MVERTQLKPRRTGASVIALLVGVGAVGVGLVAGSALASPTLPPAIDRTDRGLTIRPVADIYADPRQVTVTLSLSHPSALMSSRGGVLTAYTCAPGAELGSGQSIGAIDEQPIVALHTATPLWRDLTGGEEGNDVTALQDELARLGYSIEITGAVGKDTLDALERFSRDRNLRERDGLRLETIAWIPAESVVADACPAQLGSRLAPGEPLAHPRPAIASAQVNPVPPALVEGARTLTIGATRIPVDGSGRSIDDVADLRNEQAVVNYLANPDVTLAATLTLTEPIAVLAVPPSSVFGAGDDHCIADERERSYRVNVMASRLGSTFVRLLVDQPPPAVVLVYPREQVTSCE